MTPAAALFVDAENLSSKHAPALLRALAARGRPAISRAYGDATRCPGWAQAAGLRFVHTCQGRNCADIALVIDAVDMQARGLFDLALIASSDSDLSRLAEHLRERGATVVGFGDSRAPERLRAACDAFELLGVPAGIKAPKPIDATVQCVVDLLRRGGGEMLVSKINPEMARAGFRISQRPEKTWRSFLLARPDLFDCDPRGSAARVRLRSPACDGARPSPAGPRAALR